MDKPKPTNKSPRIEKNSHLIFKIFIFYLQV
jgi:hypothetical protein